MFQLTVWAIAPICAAAISMAAFIRTGSGRNAPGGPALRSLFLALFIWSATQAFSMLFTSEALILLSSQLAYIGIAFTPVAWFVFAVTYARRQINISALLLACVSVIPAITVILALTNHHHNLVLNNWSFVNIDGFFGMVNDHGLWFYVHGLYSYSLILVSTTILAFSMLQYKQHYSTVLAAVFAPILATGSSLLYLSPSNPYPWLDLTTVGFVGGVLILELGILRGGMLHAKPIARDRVVEQLTDPVLVLSYTGTILDANQSALEAWPDQGPLLNQNISKVIQNFPVDRIVHAHEPSETTFNGRMYEMVVTPLDSNNDQTDCAIVFRDITERNEKENQLQKMQSMLEQQAHTDALTNLYNRRFFMQRMVEEFANTSRTHGPLSVLVLDLDHFKDINDQYGHEDGDQVLVQVAQIIAEIKRAPDVGCRLGGEEFALMLPQTNKLGAVRLAYRLREAIAEHDFFPHSSDRPTISASIGVASVTRRTNEPKALLRVADKAMYRAKESGRNRVCFDALASAQ